MFKAFTKQVGFQAECKQSAGLWWERKGLVVVGCSGGCRGLTNTTKQKGGGRWRHPAPILLRGDSWPGRGRQCLRLTLSGVSRLCRFYRSSRRASSRTGGLPGRPMTAWGILSGLGPKSFLRSAVSSLLSSIMDR